MAISFHFQYIDDTLLVIAKGKDESAEEVINYGLAIKDEALRLGTNKILCDERELVYALGTFNTYESAEFIATHVPKIARIAIVCSPSNMSEAQFYETVVVNRGLELRVFTQIDKAQGWLNQSVD